MKLQDIKTQILLLPSEELPSFLLKLPVQSFNDLIQELLQDILLRIEQFSNDKRINQNALEDTLRLGSSISAKKKKQNYGTDLILRIALIYPEISIRWLLTGEGKMYENKLLLNGVNGNYDKIVIPERVKSESMLEVNESEVEYVNKSELANINNTLREINNTLKSFTK